MDLVVIAGTIGEDACWTRGVPRPLLPLPGGGSLLDALLDRFETLPGSISAICANGHTDLIAAHTAARRSTRQLILFEDGVPRGAAGCLKAFSPWITSDVFFVACGSVWLDDDPQWMLERHRASGNALTVFCTARGGSPRDGLAASGVYCCDQRALEAVRPTGYQDLKEQWVPALQEAGIRVGAVVLQGATREVLTWSTYLRVVEHALWEVGVGEGYRKLAPGVWCGEGTRIASSSRIVGPAILGRDCVVEDNALLIGPVILGDGSRVGRDCCILRFLAPGGVEIPAETSIADQLLPASNVVSSARGAVGRDQRSGYAIRIRPGDVPRAQVRDFTRNGAPTSTPLDPS